MGRIERRVDLLVTDMGRMAELRLLDKKAEVFMYARLAMNNSILAGG